jgi:hypothetical protein
MQGMMLQTQLRRRLRSVRPGYFMLAPFQSVQR